LAKADVPDVAPRRTKYGEIPKELRREMMRMCWGRYERRMPKMIKLFLELVTEIDCGFEDVHREHSLKDAWRGQLAAIGS
jgi:hypothetical protein